MDFANQAFQRFVTYIIDPTILLVFSVAFTVFVYGIVMFIYNSDAKDETRNTYLNGIKYGLAGMFLMISVYSIIALFDNTFDLNLANPDANLIDNSVPRFR